MAAEAAKPCPVCGKPSVEKFVPFCSKRCADIDLHRWLTGGYTIPAAEGSEPTDDTGAEDERDG